MSLFQPPPPPQQVAANAAQPFAPGNLAPSLEVVPNPPFVTVSRTAQIISENAAIAQPDPWVYAFEGNQAGQPFGPARLPPSTLIVPNPPFINANKSPTTIWQMPFWATPDPWVYSIQDTGAQQPYAQGKNAPGIPGQSVDNPPPVYEGRYPNATPDVVVRMWQQPDWPYVFLDNSTGAQPYGPPTPTPPPTVVVVTYTPYSRAWIGTVVQSWFAPDPAPTLPRYLPAAQLIVPNPPFPGVTQLPNILTGWQPPDPPPTLPRNLSPGIPGQSVDNPPFVVRYPIQPYPLDYAAQQPQPKLVPPTVVVVQQSPYANQWMANVIQSWFRPDPQPTLPSLLNPFYTAVPVNNPPFNFRPPYPVYPSAPILITGIAAIPQGAAVTVTQGPYNNTWLATVVQGWFGPDPFPTLPRYLNPTVTAVRVDNPPFNQRTFFPPYPDANVPPPLPQYIVQPGAVVVTQGPYNNLWLATVLASWQPADPPPQLPRTTAAPPGWSVDNPPSLSGQLVISWIPPEPGALLPKALPANILAVPVNNPPFSHYGRASWVAEIAVLAWQPPDPLPTLSGKLNPSVLAVPVNNPPFSGRTELPGILAQWASWPPSLFSTPYGAPPQVQPGPPPPPVTSQFTVSGPDVSVYLQEFFYDVVYTDAPITKRTV